MVPVATLHGLAAPLPPAAAASATLAGAWEALGGGPPDLIFPEEFLGTWEVREQAPRPPRAHACRSSRKART